MYSHYIGVDGGGTGTEGALAGRDGGTLSVARAGPSNPNDPSPERAASVIAGVVRRLLREAGGAPSGVSVFCGVAGALSCREELTARLRASLPPLGLLRVDTDALNLLSGEVPEGDAAAVVCGTGCSCFLRYGRDGTLFRIGGWGYLLDSAGSGYAIGRDGLEAVLRAHDGRGAPTALAGLLSQRLGGSVPARIGRIYEGGRPLIAACTPDVFRASEAGDAVADRILDRHARALAEMIGAAFRRLTEAYGQPPATLPVVMGGGVSRHHAPSWTERVTRWLDRGIPAEIRSASEPPTLGAVMEAARPDAERGAIEGGLPSFRRRFADTYRRSRSPSPSGPST